MTADPEGSRYDGFLRESVGIELTYTELNGLNVFVYEMMKDYLQVTSPQKDYIICGTEFRLENVANKVFVRRKIYGGKAAGRDFRNNLRECMSHLILES